MGVVYVSVDAKGMVTAVSDREFSSLGGGETVKVDVAASPRELLGRKLVRGDKKLRVAMIANWGQECGISTYTKYLVDALRPKCDELRVFSEEGCDSSEDVVTCWSRGSSMVNCTRMVQDYRPDFVLVQHEFGIFPKAPYLLQMLHSLESTPYAVVLHSTYEHLDKSICTAAMKNIVVHTDIAKGVLRKLGNNSNISVIPHGCVEFPDRKELWNIFQTPYAIVQFGFGFFYKGVDRAIDAVHRLKTMQPEKYKDIFYCYLCSESSHCRNIHDDYHKYLDGKISELGLEDNVAVIRKWNTDQEINNYLRTAKLAIFPYLINPDNTVYGASGALRVSFANGIPCIASESHLFDEVPNLPRPSDSVSLALEIDKVFSDGKYRDSLIASQDAYCAANTWDITAERYLSLMREIRKETTLVVS